MNRKELQKKLIEINVRPDAYSLDGGYPSEAYVISYDGQKWRVYYSERGEERSCKVFNDESAACQHLYTLIESDRSTRK